MIKEVQIFLLQIKRLVKDAIIFFTFDYADFKVYFWDHFMYIWKKEEK